MKKLELPIEDRKELSKEVREKARKEKQDVDDNQHRVESIDPEQDKD